MTFFKRFGDDDGFDDGFDGWCRDETGKIVYDPDGYKRRRNDHEEQEASKEAAPPEPSWTDDKLSAIQWEIVDAFDAAKCAHKGNEYEEGSDTIVYAHTHAYTIVTKRRRSGASANKQDTIVHLKDEDLRRIAGTTQLRSAKQIKDAFELRVRTDGEIGAFQFLLHNFKTSTLRWIGERNASMKTRRRMVDQNNWLVDQLLDAYRGRKIVAAEVPEEVDKVVRPTKYRVQDDGTVVPDA